MSPPMRRLMQVETPLQRVAVWADALEVEFRVRGGVHAWWHRHQFLAGLAWDAIAAGPLLLPRGAPRDLLMLGLGGGTSLRTLHHLVPAARLTAVELDPGMLSLARQFMRLDDLGAEVVEDDGYAWARRCRRKFDVVVDDIYAAATGGEVARPGWSDQVVELLRGRVRSGGLLVVNLLTGRGHRTMQVAVRRSLRQAFPVVRSVTTPWSWNEILVAGDDVASGRVLRRWEACFAEPADRACWRDLRVRRVG